MHGSGERDAIAHAGAAASFERRPVSLFVVTGDHQSHARHVRQRRDQSIEPLLPLMRPRNSTNGPPR